MNIQLNRIRLCSFLFDTLFYNRLTFIIFLFQLQRLNIIFVLNIDLLELILHSFQLIIRSPKTTTIFIIFINNEQLIIRTIFIPLLIFYFLFQFSPLLHLLFINLLYLQLLIQCLIYQPIYLQPSFQPISPFPIQKVNIAYHITCYLSQHYRIYQYTYQRIPCYQ